MTKHAIVNAAPLAAMGSVFARVERSYWKNLCNIIFWGKLSMGTDQTILPPSVPLPFFEYLILLKAKFLHSCFAFNINVYLHYRYKNNLSWFKSNLWFFGNDKVLPVVLQESSYKVWNKVNSSKISKLTIRDIWYRRIDGSNCRKVMLSMNISFLFVCKG